MSLEHHIFQENSEIYESMIEGLCMIERKQGEKNITKMSDKI